MHVDAYRLGGVAELDDLDLDTSLDEAVTVVEWGDGLAEGLAEDRLEITLQRRPGDATAEVRADADARRPRWPEAAAAWTRWPRSLTPCCCSPSTPRPPPSPSPCTTATRVVGRVHAVDARRHGELLAPGDRGRARRGGRGPRAT